MLVNNARRLGPCFIREYRIGFLKSVTSSWRKKLQRRDRLVDHHPYQL